LIREKYPLILHKDDLAIVPGCTDGQIVIEIYANGLKHNTSVDIIAADYNATALKIGYITMRSFDLKVNRVQWVRGDVSSGEFFSWVRSNYVNKRHRVVTLIQPSLSIDGLKSFLRANAQIAKENSINSRVIMPVLLADKSSKKYQECDSYTKDAYKAARISGSTPQFIWHKTEYGDEMLRYSMATSSFVPEQCFINSKSLALIRNQTGYEEANSGLFSSGNLDNYDSEHDQRLIISNISKRIFCDWKVKNK
jgi:hypothetical protein